MLFEIKNRFSGDVIFKLETESFKLCVEAAVKSRANPSGADLSDADLSGANLSGINEESVKVVKKYGWGIEENIAVKIS